MRRFVPILLLLAMAAPAHARGLLIPTERKVPPLAMLNHHVSVAIEDQVAVTKVEQTFRNHTDRQLEATYVFPVPKGASVRKFTMYVDGKEMAGELVEADKARQIYQSIVQRTQDPGLLEYMGNNLFRMRVFPVPPKGDQKISISYTSVAEQENGVIEYVYPLKSDGKAVETLDKFSLTVHLKSQHRLQNIYSQTHAITMTRPNDREAVINFEKEQAILDRDFHLYFTVGNKDVGLTALTHRPIADSDGYFLLLISPRAELSKEQQIPRDMVFVLDTSGSMRGKRMAQARNALKYCLSNLGANDRFNLLNFATTVNTYSDKLLPATTDQVAQAKKWVDNLEASGGTAINDALTAALAQRTGDNTRTFNVVFFTDGRPTIGETNVGRIQKNVLAKNTANTRIFTFGVGDDVHATFLDQLAEQSRALSTYVREHEDIEHKVSSLYSKISNPVLTGLKLHVGPDVKIAEVYPPQLPDLFHETQLVVLGRYSGKGHAAIKLTGNVGKFAKEFVYEVNFPEKTKDDKSFVEDLWARRKVGYMLDHIRVNGAQKELVDEVVVLAKRYGIITPYTSYLVVPDAAVPVAAARRVLPDVALRPLPPAALAPREEGGKDKKVGDFVKGLTKGTGSSSGGPKGGGVPGFGDERNKFEEGRKDKADPSSNTPDGKARKEATEKKKTLEQALLLLNHDDRDAVQAGGLGVDLSMITEKLRTQTQLNPSAMRRVA